MGLKGGLQGGNALRLAGASGSLSFGMANSGGFGLQVAQLNQYYGIPGGYSVGRAYVPPIKDGGLASIVRSAATTTGAINGYGDVAGTAAGAATSDLVGFRTFTRTGTAAGVASSSVTILARGNMASNLRIGFQPSAEDIAQSVWNGLALESGYSARALMRLMAAALLGDKTATTIKAANNDAKTRISYTASGEDRTVSTLDAE